MIKKSVFKDEIIAGMQNELTKNSSQAQDSVSQAIEHLRSAKDILEHTNGFGLVSKAQAIDALLNKLAQQHKKHPTKKLHVPIERLMHAGITQRDLMEFTKGSPAAKAKVLQTLRRLEVPEHQIAEMIGAHNVIPAQEAETLMDPNRGFGKMWDWMQNPNSPGPYIDMTPPKELAFQSLAPEDKTAPQANLEDGEELTFKSLAQALSAAQDEADARHKTNPIHSDPHTKGLTPEKQIANLKHHGTVFNMANDGRAEQLLNEDITMDDDADTNLEMDFEDEI